MSYPYSDCDTCEFRDLDHNKYPCTKCIYWIDGYKEFTKYKADLELVRKQSEELDIFYEEYDEVL